MGKSLRALIVEDVDREAKLVVRELSRGGFDVTFERVDTSEAMAAALERQPWDLVISDYSMPRFSAVRALAMVKERKLDLPFIIVSGTVGEEIAVDAIRAGAHDFMAKGKFTRLVPAVDRELREAIVRREHEEARAALERSRRQVETLIEHGNFVLYSADPSANFAATFVSASVKPVMGYEPSECLAPGWWIQGLHPDDRQAALAAIPRLLEVGHLRHEYRFLHKDGSWRWLSDDVRTVKNERGEAATVVGSWNDITEIKRTQEHLMISDRMASVGTLAAGVAHEINNPLAAVIANVEFAAQDVARLAEDAKAQGEAGNGRPGSEVTLAGLAIRLREIEEPLRDARESADRVRLIVRDLKVFSRADEEKRGAVDVRRVLESSLRMAWNEIRHRAQLVKDYGEVPPVLGNEARLGQVFLNLVVNAAQALPEGGAEKNEIRIVTRQYDPGCVVVEVHDTGSGIPPAVLSRIFDPFFTTKPIGVGTGLGLAICHRIVTAHGGQLQVESEVGRGTVFRTILPIATGAEEEAAPLHAAVVAGRRGRILVVDDEPMLATAVLRMLSSEHDVLALTSARDAIGRISQGERFDVILCDLMMPDLSGMDLHAELSRLAPDQAEKVVFMTGGAFTSRGREFLDQVRNPRLEKPFDMGGLRALVRGLLR